jgi:hypothetical protein
MAPFVDVDNNGLYDPLQGDYPMIKGHQMLWFVYNDNGPSLHNEITQMEAMGIEVKVSVYGYSLGNAAENIIFYELELRNAKQDLDSFVAGIFADFDLGYHLDDYIGYDSSRNLAYTYNGFMADGSGQADAYSDSIPTAGIRMLEYPGNDCAVHTAPGGFMYFLNNTSHIMGNPVNGLEIYQYLNNTWRNGSHLSAPYIDQGAQVVHDAGYDPGPGPITPVNYAFDGKSYDLGIPWKECSVQRPPADRRVVMNLKPMQFPQGQTIKMAFALVASERKKDNGCPSYSLTRLSEISDTAQLLFCNPAPTAIATLPSAASVRVFPNPATEFIQVDVTSPAATFRLLDLNGRTLANEQVTDGYRMDVSSFTSGMYLWQVATEKEAVSGKVMVK